MRKAASITTAGAFIVTAVIALIFFNFDRRAFSAQTYQRVIAHEGFYNLVPSILAESMASSAIDQGQFPLIMRGLDANAWESFFRRLLPRSALVTMGNETLDELFAYLNLETDIARVSLLPLREGMAGGSGVDAVYSLLARLPDCTLVQVAQMTINLITIQDIQLCNPPAELHPLLTPVIQAQLDVITIAMPEEVVLASAENLSPQDDPRLGLRNLRLLMRLSPILPLGLLILLTVFTVHSLNSWLDWWGIPILATGILATLISLGGASIIGGMFRRSITRRASDYLPEALTEYTSELAAAMINALARPVLWQGLILALLGTLMLATSHWIKKRRNSIPPDKQDTIID